MTIKQNGGIFGRNPEYNETTTNDLTVNNDATISSDLTVSGKTALGTTLFSDYTLKVRPQSGATIAGEIDGNLGAGNDNTETEIFRFIGATQTNVRNPRLSVFATRSLTAGNRAITLNTYDGGDNARTLKLQSNGALTELGGNLKVPSGSGIDFSATSDGPNKTNELFSDYEEGSFTPTDTGFTKSGTVTFTGRYTKIGRTVNIQIQISSSGGTTSATYPSATLTLPFTAALDPRAILATDTGTANSGAQVLTTFLYVPTYSSVANVWISGTYTV